MFAHYNMFLMPHFFQRDHCLSIVLGDKFKTLDLIGDSKEVRDKWVWGLRHLKKKYREADLTTQQDVYPFAVTCTFCKITLAA